MKKLSVMFLIIIMLSTFSTFSVNAEDVSLEGKSVLFCGDSICYGYGEPSKADADKGWAGRIGQKYNMDYINAGVSGASVSSTRGGNRIINQLSRNKDKKFDYVILHGGVNDAWDVVKLGEFIEDDNKRFNFGKFAGAMEQLLVYAKETFPDAKIGYIINFKATGCESGVIKNMDEYVKIIKLACRKYNIPYIDMYNDASVEAAMKPLTKEFLPDGIHPNSSGYEILTPYIEDFMKQLAAGTVDNSEEIPPVNWTAYEQTSNVSSSVNSGSSNSSNISNNSNNSSTVSKDATSSKDKNNSQSADNLVQEPQVANNKSNLIICIVAVVLLALVGGVLAFIFIKKSKNKKI